jgi:hypothetical protein
MAQNALTVTPPSPTPPTNMSCTGATPPNPPNFTKLTYADYATDTDFDTNPPPYFDDGAAGSLTAFAANTAALASGSGATAGGTEGSYPGATNGAVPASGSVAHEGAGTEVVVTAPGSRAEAPTQAASVLGSYTSTPNAQHASYLMGSAVPTITGAPAPNNVASGAGTVTITLTGTNYNRSSVVYIDGVAQTTNYVSATSLTVTNAPKKLTAGTRSVTVVNGVGGTPSAASTWTFT